MPVRAGWVPCVGFQPMKPMMMMIEEAENPIAEECERAFRRIREGGEAEGGEGAIGPESPVLSPQGGPAPPPPPPPPGSKGPGSGYDALDDDSSQRPPEKPNMKLLMSPKGVQDFQAVHEHYQSLLSTSTAGGNSPDIGKIATEVQSPTGKGAELFAKRKKRMDKFIVDETTVQKAQQSSSSSTLTQQQSMSSSSSTSAEFSSQSLSSSSSFVSKKQMEAQRNQQQDQILISAPPMGGPAPLGPPLATGTGPMYTAEVKVVQRASLPPTPVDMPHHSLLDMIEQEKSEKRRSLSFNMAAKGWGTYNRFYTPVTFAT